MQPIEHDIPELMQWLLGAFRLVDLHDTARTPNTSQLSVPLERPGGEFKGLWLDVGIQLLQYLTEKELEQPGNYVSIDPFMDDLAIRHPNLTSEDILFVVRQLSRPTQVWCRPGERFEEGGVCFSTKDTCLIDRTRTGELLRLTKRGQQVMQVAQMANEWLYSGNVAEGILKAVKWGDFGKAVSLCRQMVRNIISEAEQLNEAVEQPGLAKLRSFYLETRDQYHETISEAQIVLSAAKDLLQTSETRDRFKKYSLKQGPNQVIWMDLELGLKELTQALEAFLRQFSDCISEMQRRDTGLVKSIDFAELAKKIATEPMGGEQIDYAIKLLIPEPPQTFAPAPYDLKEMIVLQNRGAKSERITLPPPDPDSHEIFERFLDRNSSQIIEMLNNGPLGISDICEQGLLPQNSIKIVENIISEFNAPPSFMVGNTMVEICLLGNTHIQFPDGEIFGGNIALKIADEIKGDRHAG